MGEGREAVCPRTCWAERSWCGCGWRVVMEGVRAGEAARRPEERLCEARWLARVGATTGGAGVGATAVGVEAGTAPESRTEGSEGGGPSMAQRRDSYLDRMNESILL